MAGLPTSFKAYDIRGRVPDELNEDLAERIGRALVAQLEHDRELGIGQGERQGGDRITVVVGQDVRLSSPGLVQALARGIVSAGGDVLNMGLCGTEMVYFGTVFTGADGGVMVTASHNPMDYNGMKLVRVGARPISGDTGLHELGIQAAKGGFVDAKTPGKITELDIVDDYLSHLLSYVTPNQLRPLRIVFDGGNGCAGPIVERLIKRLPFECIEVRFKPDGTFPSGVPNPLLPGNRMVATDAVLRHGADLGVAFDGDFDRCFFFDERGRFIEGYYIVGLLAAQALASAPGEKIIHDPRLVWNTQDIVKQNGGVPVMTKTGHAFIKERMRQEDALYGGEMSAHHYFRDFGYCDSGMIPWLLVTQYLTTSGQSLSQTVNDRMAAFPCSGEINREVKDIPKTLRQIEDVFGPEAITRDDIDGLSMDFGNWRMNVRASNTEPLLRLNIETRGDTALLKAKTEEVLELIHKGP